MSNNKIFNTKDYFNNLFTTLTIIYDDKGNIYSIGNQAAKSLGYTEPKKALQNILKEFKVFLRDAEKYGIADIRKVIPDSYNQASTVILKEAGLHILAATSRKPLAKDFCVWLFSEVVPDIRKKGYYIDYSQKDYDKKTEEVQMLREEIERLQTEIEKLRFSNHQNPIEENFYLESDNYDLRRNAMAYRAIINELKDKIRDLEIDIENLEGEIIDLKEEIRDIVKENKYFKDKSQSTVSLIQQIAKIWI